MLCLSFAKTSSHSSTTAHALAPGQGAPGDGRQGVAGESTAWGHRDPPRKEVGLNMGQRKLPDAKVSAVIQSSGDRSRRSPDSWRWIGIPDEEVCRHVDWPADAGDKLRASPIIAAAAPPFSKDRSSASSHLSPAQTRRQGITYSWGHQ